MDCNFIIDNKKLYVETQLVWDNEIPIFFICIDKDSQNRYLCLVSVGGEQETYLIFPTTTNLLVDMLTQKSPMRDVLLSATCFYEVAAAEEVDDDIVSLKPIEDVPMDDLPYEGAYFEIANNVQRQYLQKLRESLQ